MPCALLRLSIKLLSSRPKLFATRQQLEGLRRFYVSIKPLTHISEADVAFALDELDKKKQQAFAVKEAYRQEIERLSMEQKEKNRELEALSKRYNIALGPELDEWVTRTKKDA